MERWKQLIAILLNLDFSLRNPRLPFLGAQDAVLLPIKNPESPPAMQRIQIMCCDITVFLPGLLVVRGGLNFPI